MGAVQTVKRPSFSLDWITDFTDELGSIPALVLVLSLVGYKMGIIYICPAYHTGGVERSYEIRM